jgi:glycosyltransferase involved in cell wall biosynthesis
MEAISAGIPVIATDVGGTAEIVNKTTGILVPVNLSPEHFNSVLESAFNNKTLQSESERKQIQAFWGRKFNASENYSRFAKKLHSLK